MPREERVLEVVLPEKWADNLSGEELSWEDLQGVRGKLSKLTLK